MHRGFSPGSLRRQFSLARRDIRHEDAEAIRLNRGVDSPLLGFIDLRLFV